MDKQVIYLTFDLRGQNAHSGLILKANSTPILRAKIMKEEKPFSLDEVATARLYYTTRDGVAYIEGTIDNNDIVFTDFEKVLLNPFCTQLEISLYNADGGVVSTNILIVNVIASVNDDLVKLRSIRI